MSNDLTTSLWTFFVVNNGNEKFLVWFDCQPWQKTRNGLKVTVNGLKDSQGSLCFTSERAAIDRKHSALWQRHPQSFWPTQQVTHCSVKFRTFLFSERRKKKLSNIKIVIARLLKKWLLSSECYLIGGFESESQPAVMGIVYDERLSLPSERRFVTTKSFPVINLLISHTLIDESFEMIHKMALAKQLMKTFVLKKCLQNQ